MGIAGLDLRMRNRALVDEAACDPPEHTQTTTKVYGLKPVSPHKFISSPGKERACPLWLKIYTSSYSRAEIRAENPSCGRYGGL